MAEFRNLAKAKSSSAADPYKATWSKLWAGFVVRATDTVSALTDAAQSAIQEIAGSYMQKKSTKTATFDVAAYRKEMSRKPRYHLIDAYNELVEVIELTEQPSASRSEKQKRDVLEAIAASKGWDLSIDPRLSIAKKQNEERRQAIKQTNRQDRARS